MTSRVKICNGLLSVLIPGILIAGISWAVINASLVETYCDGIVSSLITTIGGNIPYIAMIVDIILGTVTWVTSIYIYNNINYIDEYAAKPSMFLVAVICFFMAVIISVVMIMFDRFIPIVSTLWCWLSLYIYNSKRFTFCNKLKGEDK